ncbi:hypothetical protein LCGC14_0488590 [marine sediment metagenome]|uniref:Uncharacterized protein n=1 Tax=marine sediment metagenome TaxID=412755 RepID=A0A0F9SQF9_9ZZZZ
MNTCSVCFHKGNDVHEYPTYSQELQRDTTDYFCKDEEECLKRKEAQGG